MVLMIPPDDVEIRKAVYSYAFEDNYPKAGDYDFNDIVLNVTLPLPVMK